MRRTGLSATDLVTMLRRRLAKSGTQTALAARLGISKQYLSDILAGRREPGPKVLAALGLERRVSWAPKNRLTADIGRRRVRGMRGRER